MDKEKSLSMQFSLDKCKVCDDHATEIHYGTASCEGCKVLKLNFFNMIITNFNFYNG
jgi:hypothetical protein